MDIKLINRENSPKPRRSVLSVPGHIEKMHLKASKSNADVIMLDLEDSVPVESKEEARKRVITSLKEIDWENKTLSVRINGTDTPFAYNDVIEITEEAGSMIDSIVIPKVNDAKDSHFVSLLLDGIEMNKGLKNKIGIELSIETAPGMEKVSEIAHSSARAVSLVFGIADYSASIGARLKSISGHGEKEEEIYPGHRWHYALSRLVMAGKASGLAVIDAPYGNFSDPEGLMKSAGLSAALGCDGKWAIHPSQIDTINEVFSPSEEDVERARKIVEAHAEAQENGLGAVSLEGRMVDRATIRMAEDLLFKAKYLKLI
ncbi:MAG: CoA ester lyase [Ignavibacteria bacterium]|jgi:citrate lyase beta subunit|nr:CoA ester lyase [Ignavibacteria bacterium]MCU7501450.1 CoA ester lyase [Ignavibacteria bacterium]MCU7516034.1 CoA ester lyase [Ignavibacteria bacterium]